MSAPPLGCRVWGLGLSSSCASNERPAFQEQLPEFIDPMCDVYLTLLP
jgi:hypothetical protein